MEKLTIVVVRPWKLLAATTIFAIPSGTPLTRYPHFRAVFTAVSTASAPVFMGSTISLPHSSASCPQNSANRSWWNALDVSVTLSNCALAASISRRLPCPKFSAEYPASMSRKRRPSTSVIHAPSAEATTTGNGW